ncbi:ribonuclease H-like domain-containing protein, partial [Tanacetum coccineum]
MEKCMWHLYKRKVECFNCHNTGHFARECKFKSSKEGTRQEAEQTIDEELNHALMAFTVNNEVSGMYGYLRKGRKTKPKRQNRTRNGKAEKDK